MEKRISIRKPISVTVYMAAHGRYRRCRAKDISTTGVFIETDALSVTKGMAVELVFVLAGDSIIRVHRLPAVVARTARSGAGMLLRKSSRDKQVARRPSLSH
jgi:hypothetical protein